jgi:hypothetical protein
MNIENAVARALNLATPFWADSGDTTRASSVYFSALARALVAFNTVITDEPKSSQDQKEYLVELHTFMIFAYSPHNGVAAAAHCRAFDKIIYNYWCRMKSERRVSFHVLACRATIRDSSMELSTHEQPY